MGAGILGGNVTGFIRTALMAWLLGTHSRADALAAAGGPLDTLNTLIVNTMLFAFAPMLIMRRDSERAALFSETWRMFFMILAGVSCATAIFAPQVISVLGPGLPPAEHAQSVVLLRLFAPSTLFAGAGAVCSALLYTERRFAVPALYQVCLNTGTIVAAIALWRIAGVNGFAIGYTAGSAFHFGLTWYASRDLRRAYASKMAFRSGDVLAKPAMFLLYSGLMAANVVVTRAFATSGGPGMAAAFDYCLRCINVLVAYLVHPVAVTLVPEIARLRGANEMARARRLIDKGLGIMAAAAAASCVLTILLRAPVVALLFQRGNFTAASTRLVSGVLLGFAPSLLGWPLMELVARCFFALDRPGLPIAAAFIPVAANLAITPLLKAHGGLADPSVLGLGASLGFGAGFTVLFTMIHARKEVADREPSLVEVR